MKYAEGLVHGFLKLSSLDGSILADGQLSQTVRDNIVTLHVSLNFKDGSLHDETTVFSQRGNFRLITDHLVQRGRSFPQPIETWVDGATGKVSAKFVDDGKPVAVTEIMKVSPNIANGLLFTILKNIDPKAPAKVDFVAFGPKPRVVRFAIAPAGEDSFSIVGAAHKASHFVVHVDIGGVAGVIAPVVGKQPPDTHVWIYIGDSPVFVKAEGPLCNECPVWRIEQTSPVWPR